MKTQETIMKRTRELRKLIDSKDADYATMRVAQAMEIALLWAVGYGYEIPVKEAVLISDILQREIENNHV